MRKSRFTDEQMVAILRESDRTSVAEAAKKHRVSDQTIYLWRKHFAGLAPADVKRLKALELENAKLKRMLAERDLEVDLMREVNRKNGEPTGTSRTGQLPAGTRPFATTCLWAARRTTLDLGLSPATTGQGRRDAAAMHRLSAQYPRYRYRRIRIFLRREGLAMGINRARRLWLQAGLGLPRKRPRRRLAASRPRPLPPRAANHVCAYDFVFDSCANGQQLKCLTVVDEFIHESLAIDVTGSIRSTRVINVLTGLMSVHGAPIYLRSDNGPEFVSNAILHWLTDARIETAHIDPGKPWQNGTNESLNGKFRDECLSVEWFRTRREAQVMIEAWRQHYNAVRPHSSIDYLTPHEFKQHHPPLHDHPNRAISQE